MRLTVTGSPAVLKPVLGTKLNQGEPHNFLQTFWPRFSVKNESEGDTNANLFQLHANLDPSMYFLWDSIFSFHDQWKNRHETGCR